MASFARTQTAAALLLVVLAMPAAARGQPGWHEGFEGPQPSWRDAGDNPQFRLLRQQRIEQDAHAGKGCEWVQVEGNAGPHVYFAHDIGRPRVIEELAPSVWIKSDRPGLHVAVRVVLPRTVDPRSGRRLATILKGAAYSDVGHWQQLQVTGIPTLLTRQVHVLRMELGPQVDDREAYVDAVLLNVYGGPGVTNVWIDDLDVAGYATGTGPALNPPTSAISWTPRDTETSVPGTGQLVPVRLPPVQPPKVRTSATAGAPAPIAVPRRTVKLTGSTLLVDNRPIFPRIIQHRGEPLRFLKQQLGFNVVWLGRLPTPELLEEADRLGLWLICPPPRASGPLGEISPAFDSVLAWDLGNDLTEGEYDATQQWADQVRAADRRGHRPLVCRPRTDLREYSRMADLLLIDRRPLGTSLPFTDYATWVRQQPLLASLGTPLWTTVQTQPNEALRQQLVALAPGSAPPLCVEPEQIRLLAYTAVASGSRGLVFLSDSPLDAPDAETHQRAMSLELLNIEIGLIEPFAAAGDPVATAESNVPEVIGAVLRAGRARLLLPIWLGPMAQCVPPQSASNTLAVVVPGVPATCTAYEITPGGVESLRQRQKQEAGGMRVAFDEFGLTAQVLFAHDPPIVDEVRRRAKDVGPREARLLCDLAARKFNAVQTLAGQLAARTPVPHAAEWLDAARKSLQPCEGQLAAGDVPGAAKNAERAMRSLRLVQRAYWDATVADLPSPVTSPGAVSFDSLLFHWRLYDRIEALRRQFGPNRIAGGDFEDLGTMMRAGWRFIPHGTASVQAAVDLAPDAARSGRLGLRLTATPVDPKHPPAVVEAPPVLFTSPPMQVEAGQIVCISGWARVPAPITGSTDGLLIVDSLSGEALADRIGPKQDWRRFALYRVAPQSGPMCVTFALSGLGEAHVDDVFIQVLEGPAAMPQR